MGVPPIVGGGLLKVFQQVERLQALQTYAKLREELAGLEKELGRYGNADPAKYGENKRAVVLAKEAALRWTGNVDTTRTTVH